MPAIKWGKFEGASPFQKQIPPSPLKERVLKGGKVDKDE